MNGCTSQNWLAYLGGVQREHNAMHIELPQQYEVQFQLIQTQLAQQLIYQLPRKLPITACWHGCYADIGLVAMDPA